MRASDARGRELVLRGPPARVVSLVPSITETLFALGLDERVVGVTDYCVHPAERLVTVSRVGGTKNPDLERIGALAPDLVIANKEENRRSDVERLESRGIPVFVTYARSVREAVQEIRWLGQLFERVVEANAITQAIELELQTLAEPGRRNPTRVEALIWKNPYMVVGGDTFAHDLLVAAGGCSAFADAKRRYPRVDADGLAAAQPEVILLPTEPYAFGEADRVELLGLDCPAARDGRIHIVEGELLSWYGPRIARALRVLSGLLSQDRAQVLP